MKNKKVFKCLLFLLVFLISCANPSRYQEMYESEDGLFSYVMPYGFSLVEVDQLEQTNQVFDLELPNYKMATRLTSSVVSPSILINVGVVNKIDVSTDDFISFQADLLSNIYGHIVTVENIDRFQSENFNNEVLNAVFYNHGENEFFNSIFYFFYDLSDYEYLMWTMTCTYDARDEHLGGVFKATAKTFGFNDELFFSPQMASITNQDIDAGGDCENFFFLKDIQICLPEIEGMIECISEPEVKLYAELQEPEGIVTHALYLTDETYKQRQDILNIPIDDHFKIYAHEFLIEYSANQQNLKEVTNHFKEVTKKQNWDLRKQGFDQVALSQIREGLTVDRPVLINEYSVSNKSTSLVYLIKYRSDFDEWFAVLTTNTILVKGRLLWLSYILKYSEFEDISRARAKNDYILLKFLELNN